MAEQTIKRIRTQQGDLQIDYEAIAGHPDFDSTLDGSKDNSGKIADAYAVGRRLKDLNDQISTLSSNTVRTNTKINGKTLSTDIALTTSDIGAAEAKHEHAAADITSGVFPIERGGLGADNGQDGLKNLLASGAMILSEHQYGDATPTVSTSDREKMTGRIFFVKVQG